MENDIHTEIDPLMNVYCKIYKIVQSFYRKSILHQKFKLLICTLQSERFKFDKAKI